MKLGLLGYPINHSLSPKLYEKLLGDKLESYELFSFPTISQVPNLDFFSSKLDGLNITSPYKAVFMNQVIISSEVVQKIGAINTLAFSKNGVYGTNTDVLAVQEILKRMKSEYPALEIFLIGDGVMAHLTMLVAHELNLPIQQFSRKLNKNFHNIDFTKYTSSGGQKLIINSCSRDYVFHGKLSGDEIFWDYNYSFLPHLNSLPNQVKTYYDGQEMLELQAKEAIKFWSEVTPKLK